MKFQIGKFELLPILLMGLGWGLRAYSGDFVEIQERAVLKVPNFTQGDLESAFQNFGQLNENYYPALGKPLPETRSNTPLEDGGYRVSYQMKQTNSLFPPVWSPKVDVSYDIRARKLDCDGKTNGFEMVVEFRSLLIQTFLNGIRIQVCPRGKTDTGDLLLSVELSYQKGARYKEGAIDWKNRLRLEARNMGGALVRYQSESLSEGQDQQIMRLLEEYISSRPVELEIPERSCE